MLAVLVPILFLSIVYGVDLRIALLTYKYDGGPEFYSHYDTDRKIPRKNVNIYSCADAIKARESHPSRIAFRSDPQLGHDEQAQVADYTNSGYNKGHLITASYYGFNHDAYYNTFYLTNVSPQWLNANDAWAFRNEMPQLKWAATSESCIDTMIMEVAVPGNPKTNPRIGSDNVMVPSFYAGAYCEPHTGKSICFYQHNFQNCTFGDVFIASSISECEETVGLDSEYAFFSDSAVKGKFENCWNGRQDQVDLGFWNQTGH